MTYIGDKRHPRQPSWHWMLCDQCFDNFWSDHPNANRQPAPHSCEGCASTPKPPTGGDSNHWSRADANYHGDSAGGMGDRA